MYNKKYYHQYKRLSPRSRNFRVAFTLNLAEVSGKSLIVLDIGCGDGTYSEVLMKLGHDVVSVDVSKEALRLSKQKGIVNLVHASATRLPFKELVFDRVLFIDVFEHLKEPIKALRDIYRSLLPEGLLILSTSYPSFVGRYIHYRDPTHQKLYAPQEVRELLESTEFRDIFMKATSFLPRIYPLNILLRRFLKTILTVKARKPYKGI